MMKLSTWDQHLHVPVDFESTTSLSKMIEVLGDEF